MSKVLLKLMLLLLASLTVVTANQSKGVLAGQVVDAKTGYYLPGAVVKIEGTKFGAVTDKVGKYTIVKAPEGEQVITVSYIGYMTQKDTVNLTDNVTKILDFALSVGSVQTDELVVLGDGLKGQSKALNTQKNKQNITNVISADQVGRFPDANVGDALKRVAGITVQNDQGEARFGLIRGTSARLNSVTINGNRIPSAEAENREVQLDLISADMIESIEVSKALNPDMDADAIGGSINLVIRNSPSKERLSVTLGSGYNALSEVPIWNGALIYGDRYLDGKLGFVVSGSYNNHTLGSDNIEAEWKFNEDGSEYLDDFQIRQYELQRIRSSISLGFDYEFDANNFINVSGIFNHRDDWENRYRTRYRFDDLEDGRYITEIVRQTKGGSADGRTDFARLEAQETMNYAINGEHLLFNSVEMTWGSNYAIASEDRPNERYIDVNIEDVPVAQQISLLMKPNISYDRQFDDFSEYSLDKIEEANQYTEDVDFNGRVDFKIPVNWNNTKISFGGRFRLKSKLRDNDFFEYSPTDAYESEFETLFKNDAANKTKDNFLPGDYIAGEFVSREVLGNLDLQDATKFDKEDVIEEYIPGNFDANEDIFAGYVMSRHEFSDKLNILYGVRLESTSLTYNANKLVIDEETETTTITPTQGTDEYVNILPSIHTKYKFSQYDILRFAWSNSIARPNYYDIAPYRSIVLDGDQRELEEGNPALEPTKAMNFDLMYEHYFESVGILSIGGFYKGLTDFIYDYNLNDYTDPTDGFTYDEYTTTRNGAEATIMGAEIAFQRRLDFLPSFLKYLNLYTNYTFTNSTVDGLGLENRADEDLSLPGTAEHTFNASLSWENEDLTLRVSANYASDYIDELGDEARNDRYYDEQFFLDINGSYKFDDQFSVFFEATNLTNQALRYYQGASNRTMQLELYNSRFTIGMKYNL